MPRRMFLFGFTATFITAIYELADDTNLLDTDYVIFCSVLATLTGMVALVLVFWPGDDDND